MSEKEQFDELLGGSEKLPRDAQILKLASARASEMAAMTHSLENPKQTKLIFQKLPVHMRRRVMSHNAKRMPRKLRNGHISQMTKSGLPPKTKRPSRKYRRRPQNLLTEYNRRQRNKFWLETHIWHAKRFKIIEKWGFKLADHSNDRCFRANYRAVMNHCLIQDISYYTCLELSGPLDILKEKLKMHCNSNELTFGAKIFINGEREGTVMFYKKNSYPSHPIGHVHFLWKPSDSSTTSIWIWVHPAFYIEVLNEIVSNFNFVLKSENTNADVQNEGSQEKIKSQDEKDIPPEMKMFLTTKIPIYQNNEDCELVILRNCLNRFRLFGPLAISILTDALKLPKVNIKSAVDTEKMEVEPEEEKENSCQMEVDADNKSEHSIDSWFKNYYDSQDNSDNFKVQNDVFNNMKNLKSPNQLPPNMALALTVLDPRFFLPKKRTKSLSNSEEIKQFSLSPALANKSPLWDSSIRSYVTENCMSSADINNLRSQNLVPGVQNDEFYNEGIMHKIPILLIQKPGNYTNNNSIGFGSGIDVVLPAGWSMPFWLAFVLRCARPGGLRESKSIAYENSNLNMPAINHPDTDAYKTEAEELKKELNDTYFRLPPNKRVNYVKYGITSPFFCEWKILMREWNDTEDFYILRDRKFLLILQESLNVKKKEKDIDNTENDSFKELDRKESCYVPIKVIIERKGLPHDFSIICLPTEEDLTKFKEDDKCTGPVESSKTDPNEEKRKKLKKDHLALLRRLRRQRVKAKKKMEDAGCQMTLEDSSDAKNLDKIRQIVKKKLANVNKTIIDQQASTMANLYLPKCTSVRQSCDREVIGYVTQGGFSFSKAKGVGLGYVVLSSVLDLIKKNSNIVLTRNTTNKKYSICRIEVLTT